MVAHGTVDRRDEAITNPPCTLTIGRVPVCRQRTTRRVLRLWSLAPSPNILAWWAARLALVFGSLGTRGLPQLLLLPRLAPVDALQTSPGHPLASFHRLQPGRRQEPPQQLLRHLRLALGGAAGALRS